MKILYIGNSYTFYNDLPGLGTAFLSSAGIVEPGHGKYLRGGASFETHWLDNFGKEREARPRVDTLMTDRIGGMDELLGFYKYDAVVLQSHSRDTLDGVDSFMEYGRKIAERVRRAGHQRIVLYETWARQGSPEDQDRITEMYAQLAQATDAEVAPVGRAWREAFSRIDDLVLHVEDGSHPNATGSYIAGCVFYNIFTGNSPVGLPCNLPDISFRDQSAQLVFEESLARQYQQIAADTVAAMK